MSNRQTKPKAAPATANGGNGTPAKAAAKPTPAPGRCKSFQEALDSSMKKFDKDLRELAK